MRWGCWAGAGSSGTWLRDGSPQSRLAVDLPGIMLGAPRDLTPSGMVNLMSQSRLVTWRSVLLIVFT